jgi:hypothetical protein
MYYERFFNQRGNFSGWKCLFCGEIVDEVILENRIHFRRNIVVRHGATRRETKRG